MSQPTDYPPHLACAGREPQPIASFSDDAILYLGFRLANLDEDGKLKTETIRLPDLSCNWSQFSNPDDVRLRENGLETDGCLQFTVRDARYENFATVVHDPLCGMERENYSHCEVRQIQPGSDVYHEPPKNAPKKNNSASKKLRHAWRRNLRNQLRIILKATA